MDTTLLKMIPLYETLKLIIVPYGIVKKIEMVMLLVIQRILVEGISKSLILIMLP